MFTIEQFANSTKLPTLPEVAMRLVHIAQQEEPDFKEASRIIRSDPVVSGLVMKTVNSAAFGFPKRVDTIEHAIPILGLTLLRTIILSFHLAGHDSKQRGTGPVFKSLWRSSLTQAVLAELMAEAIGTIDPPTCFLGAMLQDVGALAMVSEAPDEYKTHVLAFAKFPDVVAAERSHFGFSHVDVSNAMLKNWGMDETFGEPVMRHHDTIVTPACALNAKCLKLVRILQSANAGAEIILSQGRGDVELSTSLDQWVGGLRLHLDLSTEQAESIFEEVNQRVAAYSTVFQFDVGNSVRADRVVLEAKNMLQDIALQRQLDLITVYSRSKSTSRSKDAELYRDYLTGLYNRRFINDHLSDHLNDHLAAGRPIACLFLDVDKFKQINDNHGHKAGDIAIKHVASWLQKTTRRDDLAIRIGGDEFLVVLDSVQEHKFTEIANRIAKEVPPLKLPSGATCQLSLSAGGVFHSLDGADRDETSTDEMIDANLLIELADQSMYKAKRSGGAAVTMTPYVDIVPTIPQLN